MSELKLNISDLQRWFFVSRTKDLSGQRFGKLTVVCPTEQRRNGNMIWECRCDCGNTAFVMSANLIGGRVCSCGCMRGKQINDLTGQRFGKLTVVRMTDERQNSQTVWECLCDCGLTTLVRSSNLVSGITRSCGCLQKEDLTGRRFGKLVALKPTDNRNRGSVIWECKCDCGNTAFVITSNLVSNRVRSCGCLKKRKKPGSDITGQRFGNLVAICATDKRVGTSIVWECRCDCGQTLFAARGNLVTGKTKSCGCLRKRQKKGETA